ncbi:MAG: DUF1501 domain-containing protein [Planctomycetaceae bacterium]
MLKIEGKINRYCDGVPRRQFLQIGGLALGGLSMPAILQAEAKARAEGREVKTGGLGHKAVIMIYLSGGPSHQDMYDLKMKAPKEIRGSFKPIGTSVPGIQICEHMPRLARSMEKFAIIRSLYGSPNQHNSDISLSGYPSGPRGRQDGHPSLGSVVSRLKGPVDPSVPPFVGLTTPTKHTPYSNPGDPGFLGQGYSAFQPSGQAMANMKLNGVSLDRLGDRRRLLSGIDRFRRHIDRSAIYESADTFTRQAFDVLGSSRLIEAMNLDKTDSALRDRYGRGSSAPAFGEDAGPHWMDQFLMARRLVEAGVRCVTLSFGSWDRHGANFTRLPIQLPKLDQAVTALVEDLHNRGLDQDVSVIAWGEFGRTPRINKGGGRDHWPQASCALLAGGGMKVGQVIGSTNRLGEVPQDRPVHYQDVFATLCRNLGIDPMTATIDDQAGRPQYLLDRREAVAELA